MSEPKTRARTYVTVVQAPEGYPADSELRTMEETPAAPVVHAVVLLSDHEKLEAEVERLRAELRTVTYERDCWKADSGRLRSELQRQAASRDGEQPEPIGDEMTMFRAMGLHSQMGGDPIGLGGLRHTREYAERDARAALADGWSEAWIEGATWRRIDVEGGEHAGS